MTEKGPYVLVDDHVFHCACVVTEHEETWTDPACGCTRSPDATGPCPEHGGAT